MPYFDNAWYVNGGDGSTTGYYAVPKRPQNAAVVAGQIVRQFTAPAVGSERCFICSVAGTTANTTDAASWVLTRGGLTPDGTATWRECTGASAVNGDLTNTPSWAQVKAIGTNPLIGAIIKRNNGASYQYCGGSGTLGSSEPAFSDTAGVTVNESAGGGTASWTCLGVVGNFSGGGAPFARLAAACVATWFAAGNTIYVGDNHAESQATIINIQPNGSTSTVSKIICNNHSGSYPPTASDLTTGATISTTGAVNLTFTPATAGGFYVYGLTFIDAVGQSSAQNLTLGAGNSWFYFDNCSFQLASTSAASGVIIGSGTLGVVVFNNSTVKFAATGQQLNLSSPVQFSWQNTGPILASGSSVPTNLLSSSSATVPISFEALDLSQLTGNLFNGSSTSVGSFLIKDCKLNASMTIPTPAFNAFVPQLVRCDSGATAYKSARYAYEGTETTETSITRVGGAVDPTGQAQTRKIVTTTNAQWLRPFQAEPYAIWNATAGANVTVTVYGTINAGAVPNNDDIWIEVEYLGSSATPLGTIVTTTKASLLASNAAVSSDGSTWNGGGSGAGWSPFKLAVTLSSPHPGMAGYLDVRVRAAKVSTTYYIDPKIDLT